MVRGFFWSGVLVLAIVPLYFLLIILDIGTDGSSLSFLRSILMMSGAIAFALFALFRTAMSRSIIESLVASLMALLSYFPALSAFQETLLEQREAGGSIETWSTFLETSVVPNVNGILRSTSKWLMENPQIVEMVSSGILVLLLAIAVIGVLTRVLKSSYRANQTKHSFWGQITSDLAVEEVRRLQDRARTISQRIPERLRRDT